MRGGKKKIFNIMTISVFVLAMSVVVSCGYRTNEDMSIDATDHESADRNDLQDNDTATADSGEKSVEGDAVPDSIESETVLGEEMLGESGQEVPVEFDYNHKYNEMIRVYGDDVYVAREDGIYRVKGGEGEEELLFENAYSLRRGMEIYQHYLFFCGSAGQFYSSEGGGEREAATIYRMDLETQKVTDTMMVFSKIFEYLNNISIYEDKLYVAEGGLGHRIGFALTPEGELGHRLDEEADDYLYKEANEYVEMERKMINASYGSEEYQDLADEAAGMYCPIMDVATCKKLLHGSHLVSQYKDEACRAAYLEKEDGSYEYLCDIYDAYGMVTETGLYYLDGVSGDILYVDFIAKQSQKIYEQSENWIQICLLTYDEDYIYLATTEQIGFDEEDMVISENCLQRIPRQGGDMEKVYQFEAGLEWRMPWHFSRHCGVYDGYMYLDGYETININPKQP